MRSRQPTVAVELVVVETKLADKLRMFRTSTFHPGADVEYDQTIVPVSEIRETIFDLEVVKVAPTDLPAFLRRDHFRKRILSLPARYFLRVVHVREIEPTHGAGRVVSKIYVMIVNVSTMHAARHRRCVFRDQLRMRRIGSIVKRDSVFPVRRAFA